MTANDAYEHAAKVAEIVLRREAELWCGSMRAGYDPEKFALAAKVADAIRLLKQ